MDAIRHNIRGINDNSNLHVLREQGRFLIENTEGDIEYAKVLPLIQHIFGLTAFCCGIKTTTRDIENFQKIALDFMRDIIKPGQTFKVETKRSDKRFPMTSNEISAAIGGYIMENIPDINVDLHTPDIVLRVELRNHVYFYTNSIPGEGGLPYGSTGKGILLLSGGIDSPVAGYLAARRGVEITPVYFHSPPFVSERAADKVKDMVKILARYTGGCKLHIVPFTDVQLYLREHIKPEKLTIMLKRAMFKIACDLSQTNLSPHCLITGDSIGQVASQTLHSLAAVESASNLPVLRPLAAMDKQQIINIASKIGTYPISIRPYEDCCTLFVAKHPENKPNKNVIEKQEERIKTDPQFIQLICEAVANVECFDF